MDKHPVTPGSIVPTRELLGDLLLQLNRPAQALTAYQQTLATDPNRLRSVYGAARAAASAGIPRRQEHTTNSSSSWKAMQTVKPRKSRKRRLIWGNHRSVAAFAWCGMFADYAKVGLSGFRGGACHVRIGHGSHRRIPTVTSFYCCRRRGRYVEADNPLRFIDASSMALAAAGFARVEAKATGRPGSRRGALRSVRRPMRAKRPQFLATRSSRRDRTCSMRTREDHSAIRGTLLRVTAVWALCGRFCQPDVMRNPLPLLVSAGSTAPCGRPDRKMTALRRLWPAGVRNSGRSRRRGERSKRPRTACLNYSSKRHCS